MPATVVVVGVIPNTGAITHPDDTDEINAGSIPSGVSSDSSMESYLPERNGEDLHSKVVIPRNVTVVELKRDAAWLNYSVVHSEEPRSECYNLQQLHGPEMTHGFDTAFLHAIKLFSGAHTLGALPQSAQKYVEQEANGQFVTRRCYGETRQCHRSHTHTHSVPAHTHTHAHEKCSFSAHELSQCRLESTHTHNSLLSIPKRSSPCDRTTCCICKGTLACASFENCG